MAWTVAISNKARRQIEALPKRPRKALGVLICEIRDLGPVRGNWSNYSKLRGNRHHCHLSKGRPTYVAVWQVRSKRDRLVEVTYVGTREGAPY